MLVLVALATFAIHRQAYSLEGKWVSQGWSIELRHDHSYLADYPDRQAEGEWQVEPLSSGFDLELWSGCLVSDHYCRWVDRDTIAVDDRYFLSRQ